MRPRGTICCRGTFATERRFPRSNKRGNLLSVAKVPRQQIVPRGRILLASLREKITPTPNKTAKEASVGSLRKFEAPRRTNSVRNFDLNDSLIDVIKSVCEDCDCSNTAF
ncbi:hypothetical protein Bbelb_200660 [Branchiostoma belcheri]|nr:hypothetical protein Bbelb_200660 [Branchiostoma belcheri]